MAQLVKLVDYVSRYEHDLSRYPTQYIRLKKYQWERMKTQWENGPELTEWQQEGIEAVEEPEEGKWFAPLFRLFGQRKTVIDEEVPEVDHEENEEQDHFGFSPNIVYNPKNIEQLRKLYLDQLFHFQIKWASSTLMDKSRVDPRYMRDSLLRSFAQYLPDNYLLFYYPILKLKKAPVELDIIMVTPVECMCITVLEAEDISAFVGSGDRFWVKKSGEKETKLLNPLIALNRNEKIVTGVLNGQEIDFPVKKYLISRNGYIDYPSAPFDVTIIDRRSYEKWFSALQKLSVPLKSTQFKAAQAILDIGHTTSMSRFFEEDEEQQREEDNES
ncbi:nuclease-related domain-containing protein [Sporosarcina sp. YIM B06819]|uniref:nuclease-related domain-containing protein n=1 Tax=Sporosarcina sp. YIM B06819 TaxID=3081769 RepID=UPI00298D4CD7|nr:nuclease-related domain-containing protein [Sporosarcina sp. YIM B06819]